MPGLPPTISDDGPLWFKDAILYELHVRAFYDGIGSGAGNFRGLTEKLPYLQDLGITAIWLLPFFPSPWRDDGYDISNPTGVHPAYGNLRDFQAFLREAHNRGLRVITELVLNHTSDQHPWFQRSRRAQPGRRWRNYYVWSDSADRYKDARVIFKDFETSNWTWDPVAQAYYWHRFYSHQPDLNFDNPEVRRAVLDVVDFWFDLGVDGLRLDAVPYLFEREGTICENLPETHAFLKELRSHVDGKYRNRMLLAEANQWPDDAAAYFGNGDECHMAFHFPLMPRLFMAYRQEDRFPIVDIMQLTPQIPENCQWALFLRNHDELTLEMVTDEERDYMYRVYAYDPQMRINLGIRRRLLPLLGNHRRGFELMKALLFSLPGSPVLYYGDEIGMGDNVYLGDRNGVRTPMQWNGDRNAGFSRANPQRLYLPVIIDPEYHYQAVNVEAQQNNPHSLLWWMKRLIALRKQSKALSRGTITFLAPENRHVLAFLRRYEGERVLVVANLSRFTQPVELDLSEFKGMAPVEMFGRNEFPRIGEAPYFLTVAPHAFYWFSLEPAHTIESLGVRTDAASVSDLEVRSLDEVFAPPTRPALERLLPFFLRNSRWFHGKARAIRAIEISDVVPLAGTHAHFVFAHILYNDGDPESYLVPLSIATGAQGEEVLRDHVNAVVARLRAAQTTETGVLYNSAWDRSFCEATLDAIADKARFRGESGEIVFTHTRELNSAIHDSEPRLEPVIQKGEQSNTSIIYGDRLILKVFRQLEEGIHPDLELGRFLMEKTPFRNLPPVAGWLEYRVRNRNAVTLGIVNGFVPNQGDAWTVALDNLSRYFERALTLHSAGTAVPDVASNVLELTVALGEACSREVSREELQMAALLGTRTAEMHLALASGEDEAFAPVAITGFYQQSMYHSMFGLAKRSMRLLRRNLADLPGQVHGPAQTLLGMEERVRSHFQPIRERRIEAVRIRCHGDYHLGQVLFTGKDFVIFDFEGEPARPLSERRMKRSPLRDVAGMLLSLHYAARAALLGMIPGVSPRADIVPMLEKWGDLWYRCFGSSFLKGYLERAGSAPFLPKSRENLRLLLSAFLLEKAFYELAFELNNRPEWVSIPLSGLLNELLPDGGAPAGVPPTNGTP